MDGSMDNAGLSPRVATYRGCLFRLDAEIQIRATDYTCLEDGDDLYHTDV